ncbi:MAG: hypothetical protein J0H74_32600 [Chitinophagaceae bacterium]|nr:hypothetical protein [Chitinophagaceae bacterium]
MTTRTILGTCILIIGLSTAGFAQNYHAAIHSIQKVNALLDSLETPHLQLNVYQPDKSVMKFRIAFSNPNGRRATITIRKKDDVYFYENIAGQEYVSLYDFNQLEDGDYQVIVTGGRERVSSSISIHTETQVNRQAVLH